MQRIKFSKFRFYLFQFTAKSKHSFSLSVCKFSGGKKKKKKIFSFFFLWLGNSSRAKWLGRRGFFFPSSFFFPFFFIEKINKWKTFFKKKKFFLRFSGWIKKMQKITILSNFFFSNLWHNLNNRIESSKIDKSFFFAKAFEIVFWVYALPNF